MVDTYDLFCKLRAGAKFDRKRFGSDNVFNKSQPRMNERETIDDALDFFGDKTSANDTNTASRRSANLSSPKKDYAVLHKVKNKVQKVSHRTRSDTKARLLNVKRETSKKLVKGSAPDENINFDLQGSVKVLRGPNYNKKKNKEAGKISEEKQIQLHQDRVNTVRKENHIHVHGTDIPDPIETFDELVERYGLESSLRSNITGAGFNGPTAIQMQAIPLMLNTRDILACAPTGSGKTLSFIIPILHQLKSPKKKGFRALILSPTRELAEQIHREFCAMNIGKNFKIHMLTKAKASSNSYGCKSSQSFDILVATPKRVVHLLNQEPPSINLSNIEWLVLDEGDKLFEEGNDGFQEQVATIYQACDNPQIHRALFSATLANQVEHWCYIHLDNFVKVTVGVRNSAVNTVEQELLFVGQESGKLLAVRDIFRKGFHPPILIFTQSKERAKELFNELIYDGINVDVIHAERTEAQRDNVVKSFRMGKIWVLIATELMGRGIDFKGINLVVNYDFPPSAVSYIHRIGRTGRAGRSGKAVTLFTEDDVINLRSIANVMQGAGCDIPAWMLQIKKPSRKTKRKLLKAPLKRKPIKVVSKFDRQKYTRKKNIIQISKDKQRTKNS